MSCSTLLEIFVPVLIGSVFADYCGTINPDIQTVAQGTTARFQLIPSQGTSHHVCLKWYRENPATSPTLLCDCNEKQCKQSNKYSLSENCYNLFIKAVTESDSGYYTCKCNEKWSSRGKLKVTRADTTASNGHKVHLKTISTESTKERSTTHSETTTAESETVKPEVIATESSNEQQSHLTTSCTESLNEYPSMTQSAKATVESETVETEVNDSATEYKVSSTFKDTCQVTTIVVAGLVAVGAMLTIIVVVIICKKREKDDIHRFSQKSGPTQTLKGTDGQENSLLPNDYNRLHRRDPSEQEAPTVQLRQENNPDHQQASDAATVQIDLKYETIIPITDRDVNIQETELYKMIKVEEEGIPEYETVA